jgi:hypothetical protein
VATKKTKVSKKARIEELEATIKKLRGDISALIDKNEDQFKKSEYWRMKFIAAEDKANQFRTEATANTRHSLDLQYMEVKGNFPILWITASNQSAMNAGTFANIRDRLKRLCPKIDLIIFTYGDVKIWELDDMDLQKIGLARITGHAGGSITAPIPLVEHIPNGS